MSSRIDTLEAPRGARRAPFLVLGVLLAVVVVTIILGTSELGWLVAMLVPVMAFTVYVAINTLRVLSWEKRGVYDGLDEEE